MNQDLRPSQGPEPDDGKPINIEQRYDIYCRDGGQKIVLYRNALFKGKKNLFKTQRFDAFGEFLEIEQGNGQIAYISRTTIVRFCAVGGNISGEIVE
jgi:hypothetical protein